LLTIIGSENHSVQSKKWLAWRLGKSWFRSIIVELGRLPIKIKPGIVINNDYAGFSGLKIPIRPSQKSGPLFITK